MSVYSVVRSLHDDSAAMAPRLENLFWRVWGNRLELEQHTLHASTIGHLILSIFSGDPFPVLSSLPSVDGAAQDEAVTSKLQIASHGQTTKGKLRYRQHGVESLSSPLPSILKKRSNDDKPSQPQQQEEQQKVTRLLLTSPGGRSITRKPSNPPTPALGRDGDTVDNHKDQKKSYFASGKKATSKRRHKAPGRRSPQSLHNSFTCSESEPVIVNNTRLDQELNKFWAESSPHDEVTSEPPTVYPDEKPPPYVPLERGGEFCFCLIYYISISI